MIDSVSHPALFLYSILFVKANIAARYLIIFQLPKCQINRYELRKQKLYKIKCNQYYLSIGGTTCYPLKLIFGEFDFVNVYVRSFNFQNKFMIL